MSALDLAADAHLLSLGEKLEPLLEELSTFKQWVDEVADLFYAEVDRFATWPEDQEDWTHADAAAFCSVCVRLERETEIGQAFIRANKALEACGRRIDPLCERIVRIVANTPGGEAVRQKAISVLPFDDPEYALSFKAEQTPSVRRRN